MFHFSMPGFAGTSHRSATVFLGLSLLLMSMAHPGLGETAQVADDADAQGEAELYAIANEHYRVIEVTGDQPKFEVELAIDGDPATFWHSPFGYKTPLPHALALDLGGEFPVAAMTYTPRPRGGPGTIAKFELQGSTDGQTWTLIHAGELQEPRQPSLIRFPQTHRARYLRLIILSAQDRRSATATVAELSFWSDQDPTQVAVDHDDHAPRLTRGMIPIHVQPLDKAGWKIIDVTSEQPGEEVGLAFDNDPSTFWHTRHSGGESMPHSLTIVLPQPTSVSGLTYLARPGRGNGTVATYNIEVRENGKDWVEVIHNGVFIHDFNERAILFPTRDNITHVRFTALTASNRQPHWTSAAEIGLLQRSDATPVAQFSLPSRLANTWTPVRFTDTSLEKPYAWTWTFPGGYPKQSTDQNPQVVYESPGSYPVHLEVKNANGIHVVTQNDAIEVLETKKPMAVWLDGADDYMTIGMGIVSPPYTLEMWVKGNDKQWKSTEVLLGGGIVSNYGSWLNSMPLTLENGIVTCKSANLRGQAPLDDQWHHLALVCDGEQTMLMQDGEVVDTQDSAMPILLDALGGHNNHVTLFAGAIDEVRVWRAALSPQTIRQWKDRGVRASHPHFASLHGYWPFDQMSPDMSQNLVGRAPLAYHVHNSKFFVYEKHPLAYPVVSDNPALKFEQQPELFNAIVLRNEWPVVAGTQEHTLARVRLVAVGSGSIGKLTSVTVDLGSDDAMKHVDELLLRVVLDHPDAPGQTLAVRPAHQREITFELADGPQLTSGIHYLEVLASINAQATPGYELRATVRSICIDKTVIEPQQDNVTRPIVIHPNPETNPDTLRVLNWNIWHGGNHLGPDGQQRIVELLKASKADIITLQESYGAQERIAEALGYHLYTSSARGNLSILSRYPIRALPTQHGAFQSILAEVTLPGDRKIHVASWWLRYAAYATSHLQHGLDTQQWIEDDLKLSTTDARSILEKDILPNRNDQIPMIIGGDFNSGSHLDWTKQAAKFHFGYGPVDLPTSKLMLEHGFTDSFREKHPSEVTRPDGTFAVVYGHLQHSRIDYIYHQGLKTRHADVIRTHPIVDFAWPSDHAATLAVFELPDLAE